MKRQRKRKLVYVMIAYLRQHPWTDEFHFIIHSRKGNKFAFCEFCRTDFSINHRGHSDVTKHVGTAKHKGNAKDAKAPQIPTYRF